MSLATLTTSNSHGANRPGPSRVFSRIPELDGLRERPFLWLWFFIIWNSKETLHEPA